MKKKNLFDYNSKILKVSQLAAISVYDYIGKKDETSADKAAVESMREELNKLDFSGTIVIGEGERDKAPMLFIGEKVGNGNSGLKFDIALDPLEGTKITANNKENALTVIAIGDKNSFLNAPDVYMEKIAVGPGLPKNFLDLDSPLEETLEKLAFYKKKKINDLVVCFLDRPRHKHIYKLIKKKKCKKLMIPDGDIFGAISTAIKKFNIDIYVGTGGAPEGVLAASALKCLNGQMQCRLIFDNEKQKKRAYKMGVKNLKKKYQIKDLIKKDSIFVATGVTNGYLLNGIKKIKNNFLTHSLIISTKNNSIKFKKNNFKT
ncbi:MAG: Fructose-1,6-bisphosphatase class 2 [Alphaproteobacteria bacterium MarineAlpha6_Bin4]|nr:MAG: Fructose-1,6-bisphosphatase class 2 [Alphaproteobacteria bacterium MarineAlpha6_Bin3]PPR37797.1 MAG: Fructose-1,6-bisphosphatase class 2 [Alphaproteobacteria bacterium MarineAlpha6_Bin4]